MNKLKGTSSFCNKSCTFAFQIESCFLLTASENIHHSFCISCSFYHHNVYLRPSSTWAPNGFLLKHQIRFDIWKWMSSRISASEHFTQILTYSPNTLWTVLTMFMNWICFFDLDSKHYRVLSEHWGVSKSNHEASFIFYKELLLFFLS